MCSSNCMVCQALVAAIPKEEEGLTAWEAVRVFDVLKMGCHGPAEATRWMVQHGFEEIRPHRRLDRDVAFRPGRTA